MTDGLRWHATGLSTMATCPEKFRRAYIEREDHDRMSAGSIIGRAFHHAAQLGVEALIEGQQPERQFLLENAAAHFDGLVSEDEAGPDPIPWDDDPGSLADRKADLRGLVELWYGRSFELFKRWGRPTMAENHFQVDLWGHTVTGQIDAATERDVVIDWKSGTKPMTPARAEKEMQKLVYPAAYERLVGRYPGLLVFVQFWRQAPTKTRTSWGYRLNIQEQLVDPGQKELLRRLLDDNQRQVDAGVYPLNISSGLCSPDWCMFWPTCDAHLIKPLAERDAPATTETVAETDDG